MGTAGVASLLNWPTHNMPSGRWPQCWQPQIRVRCIIFMKPKNVNFQKIEFQQKLWISTSSDFVTWDSTPFSSIVPHYPRITHICVCIWLWGENSNQHLLSSIVPNNSCLFAHYEASSDFGGSPDFSLPLVRSNMYYCCNFSTIAAIVAVLRWRCFWSEAECRPLND